MHLTSEPQVQLQALHELARAIAGGEFRARTILERACAVVAKGFAFERVGILRLLPDMSTLVPFAVHGMTPAEVAAMPASLPLEDVAAFRRAVAEGRAIYAADAVAERVLPAPVAEALGITAFVAIPLISEGRCHGFLTCDHRGRHFVPTPTEIELLTTIGTLTAAFLEKAIEHGELRRLNELKGQFTALASHELRTPAAVIYGVARTLEERDDDLSAEHQRELRRVLAAQARRLVDLVENLLDLSRLEADAIRIAPTPTSVRRLLAELIDEVAERRGDVVLDAPDDLEVALDSHAFDRIVSNLLTNAFRHGSPPVRVSAGRRDGRLRVTVEDAGDGVPPDFVGSLFDRFTRGASPAGRGAGLGLSITQAFTRAHGGTVTYEAAEPHGARFHVDLPAG